MGHISASQGFVGFACFTVMFSYFTLFSIVSCTARFYVVSVTSHVFHVFSVVSVGFLKWLDDSANSFDPACFCHEFANSFDLFVTQHRSMPIVTSERYNKCS